MPVCWQLKVLRPKNQLEAPLAMSAKFGAPARAALQHGVLMKLYQYGYIVLNEQTACLVKWKWRPLFQRLTGLPYICHTNNYRLFDSCIFVFCSALEIFSVFHQLHSSLLLPLLESRSLSVSVRHSILSCRVSHRVGVGEQSLQSLPE